MIFVIAFLLVFVGLAMFFGLWAVIALTIIAGGIYLFFNAKKEEY